MIRIRNILILGLMTGVTVSRCTPINRVHMAISTIHLLVRAGEWKCSLTVIESRALKLARVVTELTVLRESGGQVVRVRGCIVLSKVAGDAFCAQALILAVDMTANAALRAMRTSKGEACLRMVKYRAQPGCRGVTH